MTLHEKLDALNGQIRDAEDILNHEVCIVPVECGVLSWRQHQGQKTWRICMGDRPLLERKVEDRLRGYQDLIGLMALARLKAQELADSIELVGLS